MVALAAILAALLLALPASAAAGVPPGCAQTERPGGEWRGYGRDLANTRHQSNEHVISGAEVPTLTQAWTFSSVANGGSGDFTGTPVVVDGCMYVASTRGWVFAANADTGALVWRAQLPLGGNANNSVWVGTRTLPPAKVRVRSAKSCKKRKRCLRKRRRELRRRRAAKANPPTAGTVWVAATRTQKAEGCQPGDPCIGPYVAAFDQTTGKLAFATRSLDDQGGADVYGSPVVWEGILPIGISGGSAELGDETDRYAFQGSMVFLDANTGAVLKKTYTIHPPLQPDDEFAGAGIWSTPSIDTEAKVMYAGTSNPFKPQAEHKYANAVVKYDLDRRSPSFGEIVGSYKGTIDEYVPGLSQMPCYDIPNNYPPYYPQGVGSCGDIDLDFGASPNLFRDASGRKLVGAGQKSGVYHVFDAATMEPVWTQVVGPPGQFGGIVGSTAHDGTAVYGPITIPGYVWSIDALSGGHRWVGAIGDGLHWGPPVAVANDVVYSVDFSGNLNAFDARTGAQLLKRPLVMGGGGPLSLSWGGVSVARNTVYAAVGVLGLADGFIAAYRRGTPGELAADLQDTNLGGGGGGGSGEPGPAGPAVVAGPGAASTGYATPVMVTQVGGPLSFLNLDVVQHDVVSDEKAPDGSPLFKTPLIGVGETAPVEGLDRVQSGKSYGFFCSLHPGMRGTLQVR